MKLSVPNIINSIKSIDGINFTNISFFESFFGTLAVERDIKVRGKPLSFSQPRISDVMRGKENPYESLAQQASSPSTSEILLKATRKVKKTLFNGVSLKTINEELGKLKVSDQNFLNEIMNIPRKDDEDEIFVGDLRAAMKHEQDAWKAKKKHNVASGNLVTKKSDATIISRLIEQLIRNSASKIEDIKYGYNRKLEESMVFNNFSPSLKDQIRSAFVEYENVITAINCLSKKNVRFEKALYSTYKSAYFHVTSDLFGNKYVDDDIRKSSSIISKR